MILKRYGTSYHSVDLNFDSKALTEIGFRRNREHQVSVDDFEAGYEKVSEHALNAQAEGDVQDHTEADLLQKLETQVEALLDGLGEGEALVFLNQDGVDYPKTRQTTRTVKGDGENRLHFSYTLEPELRFGVFRAG